MTLLLAGIFAEAAFLAADSMRSIRGRPAAATRVSKIRQISNRVIAAKGGYGDLSDPLWQLLDAQPQNIKDDPILLAERARQFAEAIYLDCKAEADRRGEEDLGLFVFVAGIDRDGKGVAIAIDASTGQNREYRGLAGEIAAMGSIGNPKAEAIARAAMEKVRPPPGELFPGDAWVLQSVRMGKAEDPHAIDFPAEIVLVTEAGIQRQDIPGP